MVIVSSNHIGWWFIMSFQRDIKLHRRLLCELQNKYHFSPKNVVRHTHTLLLNKSDKHEDRTIHLYRPEKPQFRGYKFHQNSKLWSTILYIPGTAFVGREMAYTNVICGKLAEYSKCQVILLPHRLAPEYKFPAQHDDVSNSIDKLLHHSEKYKIDKNNIVLAGYSTGGTLAASVASRFRKNIRKLILISPLLDFSRSVKKYREYEQKDASLPKGFTRWFSNLYIPKEISKKNPKLSPLWAHDLKHYPPTDIIFGEYDSYRGDSEEFINKLIDSGIQAKKIIFPSGDHSLLWENNTAIKQVANISRKAFDLGFITPRIKNVVDTLILKSKDLMPCNYTSSQCAHKLS